MDTADPLSMDSQPAQDSTVFFAFILAALLASSSCCFFCCCCTSLSFSRRSSTSISNLRFFSRSDSLIACKLSHLFCKISVFCVSSSISCSMSSIRAFLRSRDVCAATRFFNFFLCIFSSQVRWSRRRFLPLGAEAPSSIIAFPLVANAVVPCIDVVVGAGLIFGNVMVGVCVIATYLGTVIKTAGAVAAIVYSV